jgi:hypothetical protein
MLRYSQFVARQWLLLRVGFALALCTCIPASHAQPSVEAARRIFSRDGGKTGDYMENYRRVTEPGEPGQLRRLVAWEELPEFSAMTFAAQADFMLRWGDLVEFVADRRGLANFPRWHAHSTACWQAVRSFADSVEAASNPDDLPATRALLLNGVRDYAAYHWIYCQIQQSRPSRQTFAPLKAYMELGPNHVGTVTLKEWRKQLIGDHGRAFDACAAGPESPGAKAWRAFVEATEAYDALVKEFPNALRSRAQGDGALLPGERNIINRIYPPAQTTSP